MFIIKREKLISSFIKSLKNGNLIVLGSPGVGKSWLLEQGVKLLKDESIPVILLKADAMNINDISDFRNFFNTTSTLEMFFNHISGGKRSILIVDALDALRSELKQIAYKNLIKLVLTKCNDWSIVASIRSYDAKHSKELFDLFPGIDPEIPQEFQTKGISHRHLNIPDLNEGEVLEAINNNVNLKSIYENATVELRNLFKIPFNIWLLDRLIQDGIDFHKLTRIRTIVELFNLYWEYRVINKDNCLDRLRIIEKILIYMVNNHTLSISRQDAIVDGLTEAFKGLLSDKVIVPLTSSEETLGFEHNMLFDYAVSRVLMKENPKDIYDFLTVESRRSIFLRPSINYYFARLWNGDKELYWGIFWYFQSQKGGEYLSILPIFTLVNELSTFEDFNGLLEYKSYKDGKEYEQYSNALCRTLKVLDITKKRIVLSDRCWVDILLKVSTKLEVKYFDPFIRLLKKFVDVSEIWGIADYSKIASAVRNVFKWGWDDNSKVVELQSPQLREILSFWIIPLVCRTYQTNPDESKFLLSQIINQIGPKIVIREVYSIAHEIESIWKNDPEFAIDIYKKIFAYEEKSKDPTQMRGGVLALTSNRRQDYEGCYWLLTEKISRFLDQKPVYAVRAVITVIDVLVERENLGEAYKDKEYKFPFLGEEARYKTDGNCVWDERDYSRDEHTKILNEFLNFLLKIGQENQIDTIRQIIDVISTYNSLAVIWKYLLKASIQHPRVYIPLIYPLLISKPIIFSSGTSYTYADFLNKCYINLTSQQRKEIETIILDIDNFDCDGEFEAIEKKRDRLLSQIPFDLIELKEVKDIVTKLKETEALVSNRAPFQIGEWTGTPYTDEEWLKEKGVDVQAKDNKRLLELSNELKKFRDENLNKIPIEDKVLEFWDRILKLKAALEDRESTYAERLKEVSLTNLVSVCANIAENNKLLNDTRIMKTCEEVFHMAGNDKYPQYDPQYHDEFDSPHWSPAPRIEAAEGIMILVRNKDYANKENIELIKKLAKDSIPVVRYHIIRRITMMYKTANEDMWEIIKYTVQQEKTNGVLAALSAALVGIAGIETDKVLDLFEVIASRQSIKDRKKAGIHNDTIVATLTQLYIFHGNVRASQKIANFEKDPLKYFDELTQVVVASINYLVIKDASKFKDDPKNIKSRTHELILRVLEASINGLKNIEQNKDSLEDRKELTREIYHPIEIVAQWLYFNADGKKQGEPLSKIELKQYYSEIKPLLERIINIGFALGYLSPTTTHHLVELCNRMLDFDPKGIIKMVDDLCALPSGYTFDSFALAEITKLIETSVVDHKDTLKEEETMKHLMSIIDNFVKAGWNEAIELSLKLDEIWR